LDNGVLTALGDPPLELVPSDIPEDDDCWDDVTSIGVNAFFFCTSLTSIIIPASVISIEKSAFSWCTRLTSITIPASVTSIGIRAFSYCTSLESITIPANVTKIKDSAFRQSTNLKVIRMLGDAPTLETDVFAGTGVKTVYIHTTRTGYESDGWNNFLEGKTVLREDLSSHFG
tara:strand:- start:1097 stop:1615 length:519 start_codon:yes stop_codon:yes gene_type:complete